MRFSWKVIYLLIKRDFVSNLGKRDGFYDIKRTSMVITEIDQLAVYINVNDCYRHSSCSRVETVKDEPMLMFRNIIGGPKGTP